MVETKAGEVWRTEFSEEPVFKMTGDGIEELQGSDMLTDLHTCS